MAPDPFMRKHHLGNIKEWLQLAETPLMASQRAAAEALHAHNDAVDSPGMMRTTDIVTAINTAKCWLNHALGLTLAALEELEKNPPPKTTLGHYLVAKAQLTGEQAAKAAPIPEMPHIGEYTCEDCGHEFDQPRERGEWRMCPKCHGTRIAQQTPLPEMPHIGEYTCADCGKTFDMPRQHVELETCPHCGGYDFDVTVPF